MATLNKTYQLQVKQTLFGQSIENVFFYASQDENGSAEDLRAAFLSSMAIPMRALQSGQVSWQEIDTYSLGDLSDFEKFPQVVAGTAGNGDTLPAHDAVSFTLNPATRIVRPGGKRIAGILEDVVQQGVFTEPGYVGSIEAFRIKLDDALVGTEATYDPVIVKRIKTAIPDTLPQKYKYELPKPGDTLVVGLVKSATVDPYVSSQVSRKRR